MTLKTSPISPGQQQPPRLAGDPRLRLAGRRAGGLHVGRSATDLDAGADQERGLAREAQHLEPALSAASATRVKSTHAVMSCRPTLMNGSSCARCRKWQRNVPLMRSG